MASFYIEGLVQKRRNSIANALELRPFALTPRYMAEFSLRHWEKMLYMLYILSLAEILFNNHYNDVIMSAMTSQIISLTIIYSTLIPAQMKENIKALRHWPLWGEFTGDRWIPHTKGQ